MDQNELLSKKHKKICRVLNYINHSLIIISTITGDISISTFCFFSWNFNKNYEFCNWVKSCVITTGIKKYKSINKEKKEEA